MTSLLLFSKKPNSINLLFAAFFAFISTLASEQDQAEGCTGSSCADEVSTINVGLLQTKLNIHANLLPGQEEALPIDLDDNIPGSNSGNNMTYNEAYEILREKMERWGKEALGLSQPATLLEEKDGQATLPKEKDEASTLPEENHEPVTLLEGAYKSNKTIRTFAASEASLLPLIDNGANCNSGSPCGECNGVCNSDADCASGLLCYHREVSTQLVPGCAASSEAALMDASKDYCYKPIPAVYQPMQFCNTEYARITTAAECLQAARVLGFNFRNPDLAIASPLVHTDRTLHAGCVIAGTADMAETGGILYFMDPAVTSQFSATVQTGHYDLCKKVEYAMSVKCDNFHFEKITSIEDCIAAAEYLELPSNNVKLRITLPATTTETANFHDGCVWRKGPTYSNTLFWMNPLTHPSTVQDTDHGPDSMDICKRKASNYVCENDKVYNSLSNPEEMAASVSTGVDSQAECARKCDSTPGCNVYVHNGAGACKLKTNYASSTDADPADSSVVACYKAPYIFTTSLAFTNPYCVSHVSEDRYRITSGTSCGTDGWTEIAPFFASTWPQARDEDTVAVCVSDRVTASAQYFKFQRGTCESAGDWTKREIFYASRNAVAPGVGKLGTSPACVSKKTGSDSKDVYRVTGGETCTGGDWTQEFVFHALSPVTWTGVRHATNCPCGGTGIATPVDVASGSSYAACALLCAGASTCNYFAHWTAPAGNAGKCQGWSICETCTAFGDDNVNFVYRMQRQEVAVVNPPALCTTANAGALVISCPMGTMLATDQYSRCASDPCVSTDTVTCCKACDPYSEDECKQAAATAGLPFGGSVVGPFSKYRDIKGCHIVTGKAVYGTGGSWADHLTFTGSTKRLASCSVQADLVLITEGKCVESTRLTRSECSDAAAYFDLTDSSDKTSYAEDCAGDDCAPPGCYRLGTTADIGKLNHGSKTGDCSFTHQCICKKVKFDQYFKCSTPNCVACTSDLSKCGQCDVGFFLEDDKCKAKQKCSDGHEDVLACGEGWKTSDSKYCDGATCLATDKHICCEETFATPCGNAVAGHNCNPNRCNKALTKCDMCKSGFRLNNNLCQERADLVGFEIKTSGTCTDTLTKDECTSLATEFGLPGSKAHATVCTAGTCAPRGCYWYLGDGPDFNSAMYHNDDKTGTCSNSRQCYCKKNMQCVNSFPNCAECNAANTCRKCYPNFILHGNICTAAAFCSTARAQPQPFVCDDGWENAETKLCAGTTCTAQDKATCCKEQFTSKCDISENTKTPNCATSPKSCNKDKTRCGYCKTGFLLKGGHCEEKFESNCGTNHKNCALGGCNVDQSKCGKCKSGFTMKGGKCEKCADIKFKDFLAKDQDFIGCPKFRVITVCLSKDEDVGENSLGGRTGVWSAGKLSNDANFGPKGTVKYKIITVDLPEVFTFADLTKEKCDIVEVTENVDATSAQVLRLWATASQHRVILGFRGFPQTLGMGYDAVLRGASTPQFTAAALPIFENGPFGSTSFESTQMFGQGRSSQRKVFKGIPVKACPLISDARGNHMAVLDLALGSVFITNKDILAEWGGLTGNLAISSANDRLLGNLYAFLIGIVCNGPPRSCDIDTINTCPAKCTDAAAQGVIIPCNHQVGWRINDKAFCSGTNCKVSDTHLCCEEMFSTACPDRIKNCKKNKCNAVQTKCQECKSEYIMKNGLCEAATAAAKSKEDGDKEVCEDNKDWHLFGHGCSSFEEWTCGLWGDLPGSTMPSLWSILSGEEDTKDKDDKDDKKDKDEEGWWISWGKQGDKDKDKKDKDEKDKGDGKGLFGGIFGAAVKEDDPEINEPNERHSLLEFGSVPASDKTESDKKEEKKDKTQEKKDKTQETIMKAFGFSDDETKEVVDAKEAAEKEVEKVNKSMIKTANQACCVCKAKCEECIEGYKANGGCKALAEFKYAEAKIAIPNGCHRCEAAAKRSCQADQHWVSKLGIFGVPLMPVLPDGMNYKNNLTIATKKFELKKGVFCTNAQKGTVYDSLKDCKASSSVYCNWLCADKQFRGTTTCSRLKKSNCGSYVEESLTQGGLFSPPSCPQCVKALQLFTWPFGGNKFLCTVSLGGRLPPWPCHECKDALSETCKMGGTKSTAADFSKVGDGYCRPAHCNVALSSKCRVNGYWRDKPSGDQECRAECVSHPQCIGYSVDTNNWCWVHTTGGKVPEGWEPYEQIFKDIGGSDGVRGMVCWRYEKATSAGKLSDILGAHFSFGPDGKGGSGPIIEEERPKFAIITDGTCESNGKWTIAGEGMCGDASKELGMDDQTLTRTTDTAMPSGCYWKEGKPGEKLWFAENDLDVAADSEHRLLCQDRKPIFAPIRSGTCTSTEPVGEWKDIEVADKCEHAAFLLKLGDESATSHLSADDPKGCYYTGSTKNLWFNELPTSEGQASGGKTVICEHRHAPKEFIKCVAVGTASSSGGGGGWLQMEESEHPPNGGWFLQMAESEQLLATTATTTSNPCPAGTEPQKITFGAGGASVASTVVPDDCTIDFPIGTRHGQTFACPSGKMALEQKCQVKCPVGQKPQDWTWFECLTTGQSFTLSCASAAPCTVDFPEIISSTDFGAGASCWNRFVFFGSRCEINCPNGVGVKVVMCNTEAEHHNVVCSASETIADFGDMNTNGCPAPLSEMVSEAECALYSKCVGKTGELAEVSSLPNSPKGCYSDNNLASGPAKWNEHGTGGTGSNHYPICKREGTRSQCAGECKPTKPMGFCPVGQGCVNGACESALMIAIWDYTGTNNCPAGSEGLASPDECATVSQCLSRDGSVAQQNSNSNPGGCWATAMGPANSGVHFNRNTVGGNGGGKFKICKKWVKREGLDTQCLAEYRVGTQGTMTCPAHYRRVPSFRDCKDHASHSIGGDIDVIVSVDNWPEGPDGCMRKMPGTTGVAPDSPGSMRWYNQNSFGRVPNSDYHPVCKHINGATVAPQ